MSNELGYLLKQNNLHSLLSIAYTVKLTLQGYTAGY